MLEASLYSPDFCYHVLYAFFGLLSDLFYNFLCEVILKYTVSMILTASLHQYKAFVAVQGVCGRAR